ncbi:hypothetical protein M378DRAFT_18391 [Amanita muscaria Koide BX008]|uniref:Uncharacterized protein n=1 Tax=Amanita muscaria (strain Koide BX008) TaxID=946122 RepID=A0A0C2RXB6_AMAMK|nr:hypothetical protein M378DRAFT_18391 [Amanita muscaria Koide BX008]
MRRKFKITDNALLGVTSCRGPYSLEALPLLTIPIPLDLIYLLLILLYIGSSDWLEV